MEEGNGQFMQALLCQHSVRYVSTGSASLALVSSWIIVKERKTKP